MSACVRAFIAILLSYSLMAEVRAEAPRLIRSQEVAIPVDQPILQGQYDALSKMSSVDVTYNELGLLYRLEGATGIMFSDAFRRLQLGEAAPEASEKLGSILLATGTETFVVRRNDVPGPLRRIVIEQSIRGIPVLGGLSDLDVDDTSGMLRDLHARFVPDRGLPTGPRLTGREAYERTVEYLERAGWAEPKSVQLQGDPTLAYFAGIHELQRPRLIWVVLVEYLKPIEGSDERYAWIDAIDGSCQGLSPVGAAALPATVRTANGTSRSP
jgi:hypothetical protein